MPFLTLNGHTISVFNATPRKTLTQKGSARRSFKGQIRDSRRNIRRAWRMDACFLDYEEAVSLENVIDGVGHYIGFTDGLEATTGLNPQPGFGAFILDLSLAIPSTSISSGIRSAADPSFIIEYNAQLISKWTVQWRETTDGTNWSIITERSDGAIWADGVRNDSYVSLATLGVASGVATFTDGNGDLEAMTDLAILPYEVTEDHILSWHSSTRPFSPLPVLRVEGDITQESVIWAVGNISDIKYIQKPREYPGIGWLNNAKVISFELGEVNESFISDTGYIQE